MIPHRYQAQITALATNLPDRLRAPNHWPLLELAPGRPVSLHWDEPPPPADLGGWLRITTGIDDRELKRVTVRLARTGDVIGVLDLRKAHALEPFLLHLDSADWARVGGEGVTLTLDESCKRPLWLLSEQAPVAAHTPHLLAQDSRVNLRTAFLASLGSLASVQPFGWMEGCVLDALHDFSEQKESARWVAARDAHLDLFFREGQLIYEDPSSVPADNQVHCIEETLPFAVLAKLNPAHPLIPLALDYWKSITREDGSIEADDRLVSAEGSYTIAYPLAIIARARNDRSLGEAAALQLRIRQEFLRKPDGLWLRYWRLKDEYHFRSWARGVAWYLIGLERSLEALRGWIETADLETEFKEAAAWVIGLQRAGGLWGCFLDAPEVLVDTSGSAGIAAALARGASAGLLTTEAETAAQRAWNGLLTHLTPDGFLDGAAQSNRGGEALQRCDYRVLSPMGMGLMGQLAAALNIGAETACRDVP